MLPQARTVHVGWPHVPPPGYDSEVARTHPPAWYPDPYRPDQLRRWDGAAWTNDVRAMPGWVGGATRLAAGPPPARFHVPLTDRPALARRLWSASAITLVFALLLALSLPAALRTAEEARIDDPKFLAAASAVCDRANNDALQPYRTGDVSDPDGLATALEGFVADLRAIDVVPDDREAAAAWIDDWERLADTGHRHAEALADDDEPLARRLNDENLVTRARINRFAYANGLTACVL